MISQEFLDLSVMVLKYGYNPIQDNEKVKEDMENWYQKDYDLDKVIKAVDVFIIEQYGQIIVYPDDYEY